MDDNEERGRIEDSRWMDQPTVRVNPDLRGLNVDGARPWQVGTKNALQRGWEDQQRRVDADTRQEGDDLLAEAMEKIATARTQFQEEAGETGDSDSKSTFKSAGLVEMETGEAGEAGEEAETPEHSVKEGVLLVSGGTPEELFGKGPHKADIVCSDDAVSNLLEADKNAACALTEAATSSLVEFVRAHFKMSYDKISQRYSYWRDAEEAHDVYVPAFVADESATKRRQRRRPPIIDVVKVPYSRSVSDTVCTYNLAVFGGSPFFRFEPTSRRNKELSARIIEQELHYNLRRVGFETNIFQIALDNNRYGMSPVGCFWGPKGNTPVNFNPWGYFPDPRVTAQNRDDAGFSGYNSWMSLVALARRGCYQNLEKLNANSSTAAWECNMSLRDSIRGQSVELSQRTTSAQDTRFWSLQSSYIINVLYIWMDPRWFGFHAKPGFYRLTVANENTIIDFCKSPYTHNMLPIVHGDAAYDAHKTFTSGMYDLIAPLQRFQDWLLRARVENVQAMVQSRTVVDPSKINIVDLLKPNSARLVRALPGQNPKDAFLPITTPDATRGYWEDLDTAGQLMQRVSAASDTAQGVSSDTQRTATEIQRLTTMGQQRLGMNARLSSARHYRPMAEQFVHNLQYFGPSSGAVKLPAKYGVDADGWYAWEKREIMGQFDYLTVDGTLPSDPSRNSEMLMQAARIIADSGLGQNWRMDKFIEEAVRGMGFYDLDQWQMAGAPMQAPKTEVMPDDQMRNELAKGNIVPLRQVTGGMQPMDGAVPGVGEDGSQPLV